MHINVKDEERKAGERRERRRLLVTLAAPIIGAIEALPHD